MRSRLRAFVLRATAGYVCLACIYSAAAFGDDFPRIYNSDSDRDARPMAAAEAAARMQVPDGFRASVFASEPDVQNPIAMTWDARGRLWVAENYTYAQREQRFDLGLRDRVLIFEDVDGDGAADRRTVFTDQVQMLTSVEVGHGGVWLMCPPQVLFLPDRDLNDHPDGPAEIMLDGFEVAKENYHNLANGLRWGPDGWLYGRTGGSCPGRIGIPGTADDQRVRLEGGIWRYSPRSRQFEVLAHGTTNPWGHDWNELGDGFFINTVNGHLWHLIPGAHYVRPFTLDPNPHVYELIDMHADHWHFDTGTTWQESRDGAANSYGGGHAHCGMMIYLGDNWPQEYRGRLLTWNIHGRRANQELLRRQGSGYVAAHGPDILLSADPFFRGMEMSYGPDGVVYTIDWSDTGECHESTGVHRTSGRVFRIAYVAEEPQQHRRMDLRSLPSAQLVALMKHRNEWFTRQARLVLAERSRDGNQRSGTPDLAKAVDSLRQMVRGSDGVAAYRALVTLHAMGAADRTFVCEQLSRREEYLRAWAIRLLTDSWPIDDVFGPLVLSAEDAKRVDAECSALMNDFCNVASRDGSGLVRLALASTLQRMPVAHRATLAQQLMRRQEDADDHNLPLLVWYGLVPVASAEPMALANLAVTSRWPKTQRLMARRLAEQLDEHPDAMEKLLAHVSQSADAKVRRNLLQGISDGLKGWRRAPEPKNWAEVARAVSADRDDATMVIVRDLSVLFGDGRALEEVRGIVLDPEADIGLRRSALETLVRESGQEIRDICLSLLSDARLNALAAKGLSKCSGPEVAGALVASYDDFRAPERPQVIAILVSRPEFSATLLDAIAAKQIPETDLTAFDVRQIRSLSDASLESRITELWGELRDSPIEKRQQIDSLKQQLTAQEIASADPERGRLLFNQVCAQCHRLFGQGEAIGPDLTGANRNNLDYLLENVVDPSAVVSKDFRMTVVRMVDGRVLNGLVVSKSDKTLTLQTQTDKQSINLGDIQETRLTTQSSMPDGLLDNLSHGQFRDLIAYLMQPAQVPLPGTSE